MVHDPLATDARASGQAQDGDGDGERIAKLLARSGVGSRRDVERMITEGRVALNGRALTTPAVKVEPGDIITVDGEVIGEPEAVRVFRYHKPIDLMTTHKDPQGRPTVFDNLPAELPRLISVGRLDVNSEGLLLLTNDGGLARKLELPSTAIVRRYRARAHGRTTQEKLDKLMDGITVEGVRYGQIEAKIDKGKEGPQGANLWLTITLHEGKNREVRRVLEAVGLKVNRLIRLAYGPFALGTLGVGEIEEIGPRVIREQLAEYIDQENLPTGDRPLYRAPKSASRRARDQAAEAALVPPPPEPKAKVVYKAGWAKPKKKAPRPFKVAKPAPEGPRPPSVKGPKAAAKPRRPGPNGAGPRPAGRPKAGGPDRAGPDQGAPNRGAPNRSGPNRSGPSRSGPKPGGRGPRG